MYNSYIIHKDKRVVKIPTPYNTKFKVSKLTLLKASSTKLFKLETKIPILLLL